jgi:transcriptional regulator with XRE-family HTH domain
MVNQQEQLRLQELGDFLHTRRARLMPEHVGLPRGSRRRSPGLRRAEVAQLAGVSVDWYTWLEQGRPITASIEVLESLVKALCLDPDERVHLFLLARQQLPPKRASDLEVVSSTLRHFLDQQSQSPSLVSNARWDVLAWNDAACVVFGDFSQMTNRERNNVWRLFAVPSYRQLFVDWEGHARHILAQFRASSSRFLGDPQMTELIHDLKLSSPEFRDWWPHHEVISAPEEHKVLNHPQAGSLLFDRLTFQVFDAPDLKVTIYTAVEETNTSQKLSQLLTQWRFQKRQVL